MDFKNKHESYLREMAQIIDSKSESDISGMNLVTKKGTDSDKARQRLAYLVNEMRKDIKGQTLMEQQHIEQGANSMVQESTLKEQESSNPFKYIGGLIAKRFSSNDFQVSVFIPIRTTTTENFSSEIKKWCKDISFKFLPCYDSGKLQRNLPLVVVCPISSRFEPDIDLALNGIKFKEPFVALVLHSGLESSLPRLPTSTKLANREKYQHIEFIDIAFSIEDKLYKCQMNETAKKQLETFVTGFYNK